MPTLVLVATGNSDLADAWERQAGGARFVVRFPPGGPAPSLPEPAVAVVLLDAAVDWPLPNAFAGRPVLVAGEPASLALAQARLARRGVLCVSYEESRTRLTEFLPLLEQLAEQQALIALLEEPRRVPEIPTVPRRTEADSPQLWEFFDQAVAHLESPERLLAEFRRAARLILRASHAVVFRRETDGFHADRGPLAFSLEEPLVRALEANPAVLDGVHWVGLSDPRQQLAIRARLSAWGARLLVPLHDNGLLLGVLALGVRDDGRPYDEQDRDRAVYLARVLCQLLVKCEQWRDFGRASEQASLATTYLPATLVLGPDEEAPAEVPIVVRDLIREAKRRRDVQRIGPTAAQSYRAAAGPVRETGGTWVWWHDAGHEVAAAESRERSARRDLLRELSLTLSHELGNALVAFDTWREVGGEPPPPALLESVRSEIARLQSLHDQLALMQTLHETEPDTVDVRQLAQALGRSMGVRVDTGRGAVVLRASRMLLEFALRSLVQAVADNRPGAGLSDLTLTVRSAGAGPEQTALLSIAGSDLQLQGIVAESGDRIVGNQGRLGVFLAKEILRLHRGDIHAGVGSAGTEILISFRSL